MGRRFVFLALAAALLSIKSDAQGVPRTIIPDSLRAILTADFDRQELNPFAVEHSWCAGIKEARMMDGSAVFFVTSLTMMDTTGSTPYQSRSAGKCPKDSGYIHQHLPSTCIDNSPTPSECWQGGVDAFECEPSVADLRSQNFYGWKVSGIQCDRRALSYTYLYQVRTIPKPSQ